MMESVLEDVPLADTYSHNMVSSCDSFRRILNVPEPLDDHNLKQTKLRGESSSLTNLTQAILHRRKVWFKNSFSSNVFCNISDTFYNKNINRIRSKTRRKKMVKLIMKSKMV